MALSKDQWLAKLKSWVPTWFFDSPLYQEADFSALAEILSTAQGDTEELIADTFIETAQGSYLDLHGSERSVLRGAGESDDFYSSRIRYITNSAIRAALQSLVTGSLNNGKAVVIENALDLYFGDDAFFDDPSSRWLDGTKVDGWITIVTPAQTSGDPDLIKTAILRAINDAMAFGVAFDVLYEN